MLIRTNASKVISPDLMEILSLNLHCFSRKSRTTVRELQTQRGYCVKVLKILQETWNGYRWIRASLMRETRMQNRVRNAYLRACVHLRRSSIAIPRSTGSASSCLPVRTPLARQKRSRSGSTARMSCLLRCVSTEPLSLLSRMARNDSSVGILTLRAPRFSLSLSLSLFLFILFLSILSPISASYF